MLRFNDDVMLTLKPYPCYLLALQKPQWPQVQKYLTETAGLPSLSPKEVQGKMKQASLEISRDDLPIDNLQKREPYSMKSFHYQSTRHQRCGLLKIDSVLVFPH